MVMCAARFRAARCVAERNWQATVLGPCLSTLAPLDVAPLLLTGSGLCRTTPVPRGRRWKRTVILHAPPPAPPPSALPSPGEYRRVGLVQRSFTKVCEAFTAQKLSYVDEEEPALFSVSPDPIRDTFAMAGFKTIPRSSLKPFLVYAALTSCHRNTEMVGRLIADIFKRWLRVSRYCGDAVVK
ncbi:hypothetical protein DPEC_G00322700 [Dallia pectoralis]|uniref:Uncharacterized protein n=1 Tax=Dallia pectoralis TaxID=75939 RepID=A0ACC2FAS1_DALPE|nr:hypothetical protein DPEC_G00322700 [Dallia pectoralis]